MASISIDDRMRDGSSEYGDAKEFINTSQYTPSDKKRKGSLLSDNFIKKIKPLPDIASWLERIKKYQNRALKILN